MTATITVGGGPWGIDVSPNGDAVYVTTGGDNTVAVLEDDKAKPDNPNPKWPLLHDPMLVGKVVGGVGGDGGGWLIIGGHFYKIPPRPLRTVIAKAIAPFVGSPVNNPALGRQVQKGLSKPT